MYAKWAFSQIHHMYKMYIHMYTHAEISLEVSEDVGVGSILGGVNSHIMLHQLKDQRGQYCRCTHMPTCVVSQQCANFTHDRTRRVDGNSHLQQRLLLLKEVVMHVQQSEGSLRDQLRVIRGEL